MKIASVSELSGLKSNDLSNIHMLTSNTVTLQYISLKINGKTGLNILSKFLIEGSIPYNSTNVVMYDSARIQYNDLMSSAILADTKEFLNLTNGLVRHDSKTDYNLDNIFNKLESVNYLSALHDIISENAYFKNKLTSMEALINNLTSTIANLSTVHSRSITTNKLCVTTTDAYVKDKYIVNDISSSVTTLDSDNSKSKGLKLTTFRNKNRYTLGIDASNFKCYASGCSINVPVGAIVSFANSSGINNLDGFLPCDGGAYQLTAYEELYSMIGDNYNESGDSSDIFRVPCINDGKYLIGLTTYADPDTGEIKYGATLPEALPNIVGQVDIPMFIPVSSVIEKTEDDVVAGIGNAIYRINAQDEYGETLMMKTPSYVLTSSDIELISCKVIFNATAGQYHIDKNGDTVKSNSTDTVFGKARIDQGGLVRPRSVQVKYFIKAKITDSDFTYEKNDKLSKLDFLSVATTTKLGGIKLMTDTEAGSNKLPVKLDNDKAYINMPNCMQIEAYSPSESNGYIKYSNGLLEQWGISESTPKGTAGSATGVRVAFSIPFSTIFNVTIAPEFAHTWGGTVATHEVNVCGGNCAISDVKTDSFIYHGCDNHQPKAYWRAIGLWKNLEK